MSALPQKIWEHQREKSGNRKRAACQNFFADLPVSEQDTERIAWIAAHHHTYDNVDGLDYQILLEADFLVNADESEYKSSAVEGARKNIFKTAAGIRLLESIYFKNIL